MPALHELVKAGMKLVLSGDSSQWDAALQMPHYSASSMPALSLHSGAHVSPPARPPAGRLWQRSLIACAHVCYCCVWPSEQFCDVVCPPACLSVLAVWPVGAGLRPFLPAV